MQGRRYLLSVVGAAALVAASSTIVLAATPAAAATTTTSSSSSTTSTTVPSTSLPAGKVTVQATLTFHLVEAGKPTAIAFTGTMVGTSDGNGHLTFPKSGTSFGSVNLAPPAVPVATTVHLVPVTDVTGTLNTQTGAVTLAGSSETLIDIAALSATGCPLGPTTASLSSASAGGVKYDATAHTATITDPTLAIPKITTAPASCPAAAIAAINGAFPLPTTGSIVEVMKVFPPGVTVTAAATSTTASTTTAPAVAAAATPTTTAPNTLPRTGSSSVPLFVLAVACLSFGLFALNATGRKRSRRSRVQP